MKSIARALVLVLAFASGWAAAADVGRVVLAAGDSTALRAGQPVRLALGTVIQDKDVLRTGAASNLQVRFEDDSYVSLRENSELRVDEFRFTNGAGKDSAVFSLLKGGLRAVTGLVGRRNNEDYKMVTPTATIGIRGTDYAATLCQGDCRNADGSQARDGVYGRVIGQSQGTNQINVSNDAGDRQLGINSNFFVGDRRGPVELLLVAPDFVLSKLEGRSRGGSKGTAGGTGSERASSGGASEESRPSATPDALPPLQFVVTQSLGPQGGPSVLLAPASGFIVAWPGKPGLIGDAFLDDEQIKGTFNGQNQLIAIGAQGSFPGASLAGGSIVDSGSITTSNGQVFIYGRWTGATSVPLFNGSVEVLTPNVPLLFGTATGIDPGDVVGKLGGVATYSYAGGPRPVDLGGNVGSITSTSTTINFTTLQQQLSLGMLFPSVVYMGSNVGSASFNLNSTGSVACSGGGCGEFEGLVAGSCTGSGCASGSASGFFRTGLTGPGGYGLAAVSGLVHGTQAGEVAFLNAYLLNGFTPGPPPANLITQIAFSNLSPAVAGMTWTLSPSESVYSGNNLISFTTSSPLSGSLAAGTIVETGTTPLVDGGTMHWGRWTGATTVNVPPTISPSTGLVFIGGQNANLPTSGSFTYTYAGGPNPTNVNGVSGTFGGGAFNITFGASSGSLSVSTPLTLAVGGVSYSLNSCTSGCTFTNSSSVAGNMQLAGTCAGGACSVSAPATGSGAGVFVGPQGAGFAVAGSIFSPAPTVAFGAGFKR